MAGIFDVGALRIARNALDGLSRRQEAVGSNIANIDTPGYRRKAVDFERALAERIAKPNATTLERTDARHVSAPAARGGGLGGPDGSRDAVSERNDSNSVSIDEEMTLLAETQIRYQALTQSISQLLSTLRAVIRG